MGVLSAAKPENFSSCNTEQDIKVLTGLPGIGKKMAERLILELKDKVDSMDGSGAIENVIDSADGENNNTSEAIEALRALGYTNTEIYPVVKAILNCNELSTENIIRQAFEKSGREEIMNQEDRVIMGQEQSSDTWQYSLRPRQMSEYIGARAGSKRIVCFY